MGFPQELAYNAMTYTNNVDEASVMLLDSPGPSRNFLLPSDLCKQPKKKKAPTAVTMAKSGSRAQAPRLDALFADPSKALKNMTDEGYDC